MKKLLIIALTLMLTAASLSLPALASPGDAVLTRERLGMEASDLCAVGNAVWLQSRRGVARYDAASESIENYTWDGSVYNDAAWLPDGSTQVFTGIDAWFGWNGGPWALRSTTYDGRTQAVELCRVDLSGDIASLEPVREIDFRRLADDGEFCTAGCFAMGDALFALVPVEERYTLCRIPLNGDKPASSGLSFSEICRYDGQVLGVVDEYRNGGMQMVFTLVDPDTGKAVWEKRIDMASEAMAATETAPYASLSGIAQEPNTERILFVIEGRLAAFDPQTDALELLCAYPGNPDVSGCGEGACVLDRGLYCAAQYDCLALRAIANRQNATEALTIAQPHEIPCVRRAAFEFDPDVEIFSVSLDDGSAEVLDQLLTRSPDVDIYLLGTDYDTALGSILDRGWAAKLESKVLSDYVSSLYPAFAGQFTQNGKPVAIPLEAHAYGLGLNVGAMAALGLRQEDVPASWPDFCAWLNDAAAMARGRYPVFMDEADYVRMELMAVLCRDCAREIDLGAQPGFSAPAVRAAMEAVDAIDLEAICESDEALWESEAVNPLFFAYANVGVNGHRFTDRYDSYPLRLSLDSESPVRLPVGAVCAVVNPFSPHPETAVQFLESVVSCMEPQSRAMLDPHMNKPLRDESQYREQAAEQDALIESLMAQLAKRDSPSQAMEEALAEAVRTREEMEEKWYWIVSRESLDWYRAHDGGLIADFAGVFSDISPYELLAQYAAGQLDLDGLITALDDRTRLRRMED